MYLRGGMGMDPTMGVTRPEETPPVMGPSGPSVPAISSGPLGPMLVAPVPPPAWAKAALPITAVVLLAYFLLRKGHQR